MTPSSKIAKTSIVCKDNGPYIVNGISSLIGTNDEAMTAKSTMALCRCGQSAIKPFCDGTHAKIGFSSETDIYNRTKSRKDTYVGEKITVYDNRGLCAHAGVCTDKLASVFRIKKEPWIDLEQAAVDEIMAIVDQCPSGALSYSVAEIDQQPLTSAASVTVIADGPYHISGKVELEGINSLEGASGKTCTLCRCGHSKNKPFCDGSHWSAGFKDA